MSDTNSHRQQIMACEDESELKSLFESWKWKSKIIKTLFGGDDDSDSDSDSDEEDGLDGPKFLELFGQQAKWEKFILRLKIKKKWKEEEMLGYWEEYWGGDQEKESNGGGNESSKKKKSKKKKKEEEEEETKKENVEVESQDETDEGKQSNGGMSEGGMNVGRVGVVSNPPPGFHTQGGMTFGAFEGVNIPSSAGAGGQEMFGGNPNFGVNSLPNQQGTRRYAGGAPQLNTVSTTTTRKYAGGVLNNTTTQKKEEKKEIKEEQVEEEQENVETESSSSGTAEVEPKSFFIGSLKKKHTQSVVRRYFSLFGDVRSVVIKKMQGFGFVNMYDAEAVTHILEQKHQISGSIIEVRPYYKTKAEEGGNKEESEPVVEEAVEDDDDNELLHFSPTTFFVGGLKQTHTKTDVKEYFSTFGDVSSVTIKKFQSGNSRGFGFVTMNFAGIVDKILELQGTHEIDGWPIDVREYGKGKEKISKEEKARKKRAEAEGRKKKKEQEEARKKEAEAEARKKQAEEEARKKKEEAEAARKKKWEAGRKKREAEEAARKREAEEAARKMKEAEEAARKRKEQEEARKKIEAEEAARKKIEAEALRKKDAAAAARKREAEEAARKQREAEDAMILKEIEEAEKRAKKAEEEARTQREAEIAKQKAEEEARKKREEEEEARKKEAKAARRKKKAEKEAKKKAKAEKLREKNKILKEARKKKEEEEAARKREEEEEARKKQEAEEAARKQREAEEAARKKEEEAARKEEEARKPIASSSSSSSSKKKPMVLATKLAIQEVEEGGYQLLPDCKDESEEYAGGDTHYSGWRLARDNTTIKNKSPGKTDDYIFCHKYGVTLGLTYKRVNKFHDMGYKICHTTFSQECETLNKLQIGNFGDMYPGRCNLFDNNVIAFSDGHDLHFVDLTKQMLQSIILSDEDDHPNPLVCFTGNLLVLIWDSGVRFFRITFTENDDEIACVVEERDHKCPTKKYFEVLELGGSPVATVIDEGDESQVGARIWVTSGQYCEMDVKELVCVAPKTWETKDHIDMPGVGFVDHSATLWNPTDGSDPQLIVFGGQSYDFDGDLENWNNIRDVALINVNTCEGTLIPMSGNVPVHGREGHIAVVVGDYLVVGEGNSGGRSFDFFDWGIFDLKLGYWLDDVWNLPHFYRRDCTYFVRDNIITTFGGENFHSENPLMALDIVLPPQLLGEWDPSNHKLNGKEFNEIVTGQEDSYVCETNVTYELAESLQDQFGEIPPLAGYMAMQARKDRMVTMLKFHVSMYDSPLNEGIAKEMMARGMIESLDEIDLSLEWDADLLAQVLDKPPNIRFLPPPECGKCGKWNEQLMKCTGCHNIKYCSQDCQKAHWKVHKKICKKSK